MPTNQWKYSAMVTSIRYLLLNSIIPAHVCTRIKLDSNKYVAKVKVLMTD